MKKVHIFSYHQIIETNRLQAIEKFSEATKLEQSTIAEIAIREENVGGNIYRYKTGNISSEEFHSNLNEIFKNKSGLTLNDQTFNKCWNAMCMPQSITFKKIHELQQKHNFSIHIIGNTNVIQHEYIQNEIKNFQSTPDITYTLSFKEKTLDNGKLKQSAVASFTGDYLFEFHNEKLQDASTILADIYEYNQ